MNPVAAFGHNVVGSLQSLVERFVNGLPPARNHGRAVHLEEESLRALQQRVVQFSRNACAFARSALRELTFTSGQLADTRLIEKRQDTERRASAKVQNVLVWTNVGMISKLAEAELSVQIPRPKR